MTMTKLCRWANRRIGAMFCRRLSTLPLSGVTVVALEHAVAAPFCTSRLADAGARVIKLERRGKGDFLRYHDSFAGGKEGTSSHFAWVNRGKESLEIDIKDESDQALIKNILRSSKKPVFVQNLSPGSAERVGLGSEQLRQLIPKLITVDISGYGNNCDLKAYDMLVQAEVGLAHLSGPREGEPCRVGVSVADISCGMTAYTAVLEAIIALDRGEGGTKIEVSLFAAVADWMNVPYMHFNADPSGQGPSCLGLRHPYVQPYAAYPNSTGEENETLVQQKFLSGWGRPILISIQNDREFKRFCTEVLGDGSLALDPRFVTNIARCIDENSKELDRLISHAFLALTRDEVIQRLRKANTAYGEVNDMARFAEHFALNTTEIEISNRDYNANPVLVRCINPAAKFDGLSRKMGKVPALGEHSNDIRREFSCKPG